MYGHKDTTDDCNDQLSNTDGCIEAEEGTQEHIDDEIINAPVPEMMEETVEVVQHNPQEQVQCIDQIVDVSVVTQGQVLASQTVQKRVEVPQVQFLDRVVDVPVVAQRQMPRPSMLQERIQERIVEETDIPVRHMMEKTIEVMKPIPQERVQNNTVEQIVEEQHIYLTDLLAGPSFGRLCRDIGRACFFGFPDRIHGGQRTKGRTLIVCRHSIGSRSTRMSPSFASVYTSTAKTGASGNRTSGDDEILA